MTRARDVDRGELQRAIERMAELRAVVVGDLLLDEYRSGQVDRVSPEAPVPIVRVDQTSHALGGAGNVARNAVGLGASCALHGLIGSDPEGEVLRALVAEEGIDPAGLVSTAARPTAHKLRVVARGQQMLRLDREDTAPVDEASALALRTAALTSIAEADVVLLVDYDKGLFAQLEARGLIETARVARPGGVPVIADPKRALARFRGASLVKPNLREALALVGARADDPAARRVLCEKLRDELGGGEIVVTRGRAGMSALDLQGRFFDVPTRPLEVYDVQGAGDTSLAALALCRAAGASLVGACIVANAAAAVVVEKVGTAAVEPEELLGRLPEAIAAYEWAVADAGAGRSGSGQGES